MPAAIVAGGPPSVRSWACPSEPTPPPPLPPADRRARRAGDGAGAGEGGGFAVAVPQVGVVGGREQRLARPGAADEDGQPRLDRAWRADGVAQGVEASLMRDALTLDHT